MRNERHIESISLKNIHVNKTKNKKEGYDNRHQGNTDNHKDILLKTILHQIGKI